VNPVLGGALTLACTVASLFFLRYWRDSRDRLFLFLSCAFLAMAANWLELARSPHLPETAASAFVPRLVAFLLIIAGIIDKNRRSGRPNA
jgi:peptidoglycan/LPS O-acetylase OafA/YrhL